MKREIKQFEYRDIDYMYTLRGYLEAKLDNRLREGYVISRDVIRGSWRGFIPPQETNNKKQATRNRFFDFLLFIFDFLLFIFAWAIKGIKKMKTKIS